MLNTGCYSNSRRTVSKLQVSLISLSVIDDKEVDKEVDKVDKEVDKVDKEVDKVGHQFIIENLNVLIFLFDFRLLNKVMQCKPTQIGMTN